MRFKCSICQENHEGLPDYGYRWPDHYFDVPETERKERVVGDEDMCSIDNEMFFIRGVIQIPVVDYERKFGIGVWVSQKRENFETYAEKPDTDQIGPFFGWLCNTISFYHPETQSIKTMAHFRGNRLRPLISIEKSDHQLYKDWSEGITLAKAFEYIHAVS